MNRNSRTSASVMLILVSLLALSWTEAASGQVVASESPGPSVAEPTPLPSLEAPDPIHEPKPSPEPKEDSPSKPERDRTGSLAPRQPSEPKAPRAAQLERSRKPAGLDRSKIWWSIGYRTPGTFDTGRIGRLAARLEGLGHDVAASKLYSPFIIAGPAHWSDTWGDIRHADGDDLRPHLGQDVYCELGAPVLAAAKGKVEFTTDPLGGIVAKLHREAGGYFYYGHLARWNTKEFSSGDVVRAGDVIGFCGITGNAQTTPPHVHFGWIAGGHINPMEFLVGRLRAAERQAISLLARIRKQRIAASTATTIKRLYGERFLPNLSTITCVASTPSVLATTHVDLVEMVGPAAEGCLESES